MTTTIQAAEKFAKENTAQVAAQYRPKIHFAAPYGWLNDPNGLIYYQGYYHLYYQHNPYGANWDTMHWGHARSKDLVHWEDLPIAMAPDEEYDRNGVFSGSAIVHDNRLYVMYTGHVVAEDGTVTETQNIAWSDDSIHFTKYEKNPVLAAAQLLAGGDPADFRDPKVFTHAGRFYAVIAAAVDGAGQILLYESEDLLHWQYTSSLLANLPELGRMTECPDFFTIGGQDALVFSAIMPNEEPHLVQIALGKLDWATKTFQMDSLQPLDQGLDFYAPQSFEHNGRRIVIPWLRHAEMVNYLADHDQNWNGQMGIPRILTMVDGQLRQTPAVTGAALQTVTLAETATRSIPVASILTFKKGLAVGQSIDLESPDGVVKLRQTTADTLELQVHCDLEQRQLPIKTPTGQGALTLVLDRSALEVFASDGAAVASLVFFFPTAIDTLKYAGEANQLTVQSFDM